MKRFGINLLLVILTLSIFSCDNDEELSDIDFNTTIVKSLPVSVSTTNEMTASVLLDATSDAEIGKYVGKITKYVVTELLFAVENYTAPNPEEIYFNGEIGFGNKTQNQSSTACPLSPYNITHVANTGDSPISTCNSITDDIADILLVDNAVKIYMDGAYTKAPCSFDLKVTIKVKVTAVE